MKTIGERIQQARLALGWSAFDLAKRVGYKTQSGIGNLESRVGGSGGNKIAAIAKALNVPLEWLMNGPDSDVVPFLPPIASDSSNPEANEPNRNLYQIERTPEHDEWTLAAIALMKELDMGQRQAMVAKMREFKQFLGPPIDGQTLLVAK